MAKKTTKKSAKKTSEKPAKKTAETAAKKTVKKQENDPLTGVLAVLLIISVLANVWFFFQIDSKNREIATLTAGMIDNNGTLPQQTAKVKMEIFSEFLCPYCKRATETVDQLRDTYGDQLDIEFKHFIVHAPAQTAAEASECARDQGKFWEMHDIMFDNQGSLDTDSIKQYAEQIGLNINTFNDCLDSGEKEAIVLADVDEGRKRGVSGTPTFFINGEKIVGAQPYETFETVIDEQLNKGTQGTTTTTVPVVVTMTVLNDENCLTCDTSQMYQAVAQIFPGAVINEVDYNTEEGKQLADDFGIDTLPAYLLSEEVTETANYENVRASLIHINDQYLIDPRATGASYMIDREAKPNSVDLFVMSMCPYGTLGEQNMKEVLDLFGDRIEFNLYFIANEVEDGFSSLHGQPEVDEDIRQLCVIKNYPETYMDYILCIAEDYQNAASIWEQCAGDTGIDAIKIKACSEGDEGKQLLSDNIKVAQDLGVSGSPTFLINNQIKLGGLVPADYLKTSICTANEGLEGCDETLNSTTEAAAGGAC